MKIKINDKEIELKQTVRSLIIYENITGQSMLQPQTMEDVLTYFFCVVLGSSKDYSIKYEDFLDTIDENPSVIQEFTEWMREQAEKNETLKKN